MNRWRVVSLGLAVLALAGCAGRAERDVLWQTATVSALLEGVYDGEVTVEELVKHGDLGLGTFDALDGEMVVVDGTVYQVDGAGNVHRPPPETKTPFAAVTFFDADRVLTADGAIEFDDLKVLIDRAAPAKNVPLAIRITGTFAHVKTRSVPKQTRPYPRLVEVTKNQPTFEFADTRGVMAGFRCPPYVEGINVPGYHLHFLTHDRTGGGHVLELTVEKVRIEIDETPALHVALPAGEAFGTARIAGDTAAELERAER
ncbi:MAG TPA: acetolactate decarboxylase [Phycisphaerae bacterium]|nr:acetolactate decarboxylase [Phycisphaerae bacterium]